MELFSKTLDKKHYDNAYAIAEKLGVKLPSVTTHKHYSDSFGKWDEVKNYDSTEAHLDEVKKWQDNLNSNPTNSVHVKRFIDNVGNVRKQVTTKYPPCVFEDPAQNAYKKDDQKPKSTEEPECVFEKA